MAETDLHERLARIDHALRGHGAERQATGLAPWALALSGMAAGAALFAAGAALMRMLS